MTLFRGVLAATLVASVMTLVAETATANESSEFEVTNRPRAARRFATLPSEVRFPEGIAADPRSGQIFVGTFDFGPNANQLLRFSRTGRLEVQKDFGGAPLLGLVFNKYDNNLYIANFGASEIQRIPGQFTADTPTETVAQLPSIGAPSDRFEGNPDGSQDQIIFGSNGFPAPNAMTFGSDGTLYVSDSFQGAVYAIENAATCTTPCEVTTLVQDPLLLTAGFPPFGANGLALNSDETELFVANTGDDRVLKIDLATQTVAVFSESINGADGLVFANGTLWVAANQSDQLIGLDASGRVTHVLGANRGIVDGQPRALLFPASTVLVGKFIYVTNLALPLTDTAGDEIEEDVTSFTVSRIRLP